MPFTWTELLDDIKVRGAVPTGNNTFTAARFLSLTNATMRSKMVPLVNKVRENFYSYDVDTAINASGIYPINTRAVAVKLQDICLVSGTRKKNLIRYWEEELVDTAEAPNGDPGFYLKRNGIYLLPPDGSGFSHLRQSILMRPNALVPQDDAAQVTGIAGQVVTCGSVPTDWTTASILDIVDDDPHFDWLAIDQAISAIVTGAAGTITFSSTLPSSLAVGDWISLAGESPVVQLPVELNTLLAQEVANVCLKSQGDKAALEMGKEEAKMLADAWTTIITPRVEKEGKRLVNRTGMLRRGL